MYEGYRWHFPHKDDPSPTTVNLWYPWGNKLTKARSKYPKLSRIQRLYLDRNVVAVGTILGVHVIMIVCLAGIFRSIQEGAEENQLLELRLGEWTLCYPYLGDLIHAGGVLLLLT